MNLRDSDSGPASGPNSGLDNTPHENDVEFTQVGPVTPAPKVAPEIPGLPVSES